jgi:hypothetical protein
MRTAAILSVVFTDSGAAAPRRSPVEPVPVRRACSKAVKKKTTAHDIRNILQPKLIVKKLRLAFQKRLVRIS